ncbi:MAG: zinc-ribbon domain-containing protein, partial [Acidobacteriota bacterium]|nr:zinc-ribbon domain-containing protein [Acidobacteriota bacterium]
MLESVHCPKCATHYALRPPRVLSRHRRAKCFTCDHVFSIAEEVQRLMAEGSSLDAGMEAQPGY